jgi:anti-sigma-K factor RskA
MTERDPMLAAEYALGVLDGEELLAARGLEASDAAFAAEVAQWRERLAPLLDEVPVRLPPTELWALIEQTAFGAPGGEVVALRRSVRRWQWVGGLSAAAAVTLAFLALPALTPRPDSPDAPPSTPLAANMPIDGTPLRLDFTYLPDRRSLLVTAVGLIADGVHDHEIWLVEPGGELVSLGVVNPGVVQAHSVPAAVAPKIANGAQILLTREPLGGKPEGADAGPVVAEASFTAI